MRPDEQECCGRRCCPCIFDYQAPGLPLPNASKWIGTSSVNYTHPL
jgi:hypothetical protein